MEMAEKSVRPSFESEQVTRSGAEPLCLASASLQPLGSKRHLRGCFSVATNWMNILGLMEMWGKFKLQFYEQSSENFILFHTISKS